MPQTMKYDPGPDLWHQVYKRVSLGNRPDPNVGAVGCEGGSGLALSAYQDPERDQARTPEKVSCTQKWIFFCGKFPPSIQIYIT